MSAELATYLDLLFGAEPETSFAEIRFKLRSGGMGREFVGLGDRRRLAAMIVARGAKTDCYVGVCPRVRQAGGRDAVERGHVLWVDCDDEPAVAALERFEPAPSMVIRSGSGVHGYFSIFPPLSPVWLERANRRLAYALGADMRATDAARILRAPSTFNHKTGEPVPVVLERMTGEVYEARAIVDGLPDPPAPRRRERPPEPRMASDDPLLALPAAVYVEALTGQVVGRDGKVRCPFHDDGTPSLHVYNSAEAGWACFGCEAPPGKDALGGDIYAFAARLYGLEPRGRGFHEIRQRLEADLLGLVA